MQEAVQTQALFDLSKTVAADLLARFERPWDALPHISEFILSLGAGLDLAEYDQRGEDVWISKQATVFPSAYIKGPCIIMAGSEVRHCAFIRGSALVGRDCVVGNSTELKNVILFDHVEVPHYNYVGDSILGYKAHMGAGSITSNIKADRRDVVITGNIGCAGESACLPTHLRKMGAMIGDYAEIGCNSVLNPGTIIGRRTSVYPLTMVRGFVPADSIYKSGGGEIVTREEKV